MENLKQVLFERSHFPWNSSPQVFQNCFSIVFFHARYVFQDVLYSYFCFSLLKNSFSPFIPSSSSYCGTDTKRYSGGR